MNKITEERKIFLTEYARLIVKVGVNLQEDQILVINTPIECAPFARMIEAAAFDAGAHDVVMSWNDELAARIRYEKGKRFSLNFPRGGNAFTKTMLSKARPLFRLRRRIPKSLRELRASV